MATKPATKPPTIRRTLTRRSAQFVANSLINAKTLKFYGNDEVWKTSVSFLVDGHEGVLAYRCDPTKIDLTTRFFHSAVVITLGTKHYPAHTLRFNADVMFFPAKRLRGVTIPNRR
jgi:hypothetical protein